QLSLRNPDDTSEPKAKPPVSKEENADTVPAVVAAADVAIDSLLTERMLKIERRSKDSVPPGSLRSIEEAVAQETVWTRAPGDVRGTSRLRPKGSVIGLDIPKGMRAFTIQMPNVASSVAGFTRPRSRVDVLFTLKNKGPNEGLGTPSLLEDILVLAV